MASEQMPQLPAIRSIGGTENNLVDTSLSATAGASEVRIGPRLRRRLRSEPPFELTPQNDPRQLSMLAYWQGMSTA